MSLSSTNSSYIRVHFFLLPRPPTLAEFFFGRIWVTKIKEMLRKTRWQNQVGQCSCKHRKGHCQSNSQLAQKIVASCISGSIGWCSGLQWMWYLRPSGLYNIGNSIGSWFCNVILSAAWNVIYHFRQLLASLFVLLKCWEERGRVSGGGGGGGGGVILYFYSTMPNLYHFCVLKYIDRLNCFGIIERFQNKLNRST